MNCIDINPFRILGLFSNSSLQEMTANIHKIQAYFRVNKSIEFDTDFNTVLGNLERTESSVLQAQAELSLVENRVKNSLFWFAKSTSLDEIAIAHFSKGNIEKAKEILIKKLTFSSLVNLGVIALIEEDLPKALYYYCQIIHDSSYRHDFLRNCCGGDTLMNEIDLSHLFYDALSEQIYPKDILPAISSDLYKNDYVYVKDKWIDNLTFLIRQNVQDSSCDENDTAGEYKHSAVLLYLKVKDLLIDLKACSVGEKYSILADSVSKQLLQLAIDYYRKSNSSDKARECHNILTHAYDLACSSLLKNRCKENLQSIENIIKSLPPKSISKEDAGIRQLIKTYKQNDLTISGGITLIKNCTPYLARIKEELGGNDDYYMKISSLIENIVLSSTIQSVNKILEDLQSVAGGSVLSNETLFSEVIDTLTSAWLATQYMQGLDLTMEARQHFLTQKSSLKGLLSQFHLSTTESVSFSIISESEIFSTCSSKYSLERYLEQFPTGKYVETAKKRIQEIEQKEKAHHDSILDRINKCTTVNEAVQLKSSCSYNSDLSRTLNNKAITLCQTKSDYRLFLKHFDDNNRNRTIAESHLKSDLRWNKVKDYIKEHKGWFIFSLILIIVSIVISFVWGLTGWYVALRIIAIISGFAAFGMIYTGEPWGCAMFFVLGALAFFSYWGSNDLETYVKSEEEYARILEKSSVSECEKFLERYPGSKHTNSVVDKYLDIIKDEGIIDLYTIANRSSNSTFRQKTKNRVQYLCDSLYEVAKSKSSIAEWRKYQSLVPSDYYSDSEQRIEQLERIAWNTEPKAWRQAYELDNIEGYSKYLEMYPKGKHAHLADKRIIDIQVANIHYGDHGSLPAMDKVGYGSGPSSTISVYNNTSYTMTLLYSSNVDSKRLVLGPQSRKSVTLKNGSYRIAASVNASNVSKFAGSEELQGGSYSVEYYIVTTTFRH